MVAPDGRLGNRNLSDAAASVFSRMRKAKEKAKEDVTI
jgi:hypothetical protein